MEWVNPVVSWIWSNLFALAALGISVWALVRTCLTEKKLEKRNLIKERDDLLDIALKTQLSLSDLDYRITNLVISKESDWSENALEKLRNQGYMIQEMLRATIEQRGTLKASEPTAKLLDAAANPLRENLIIVADMYQTVKGIYEGAEGQ